MDSLQDKKRKHVDRVNGRICFKPHPRKLKIYLQWQVSWLVPTLSGLPVFVH